MVCSDTRQSGGSLVPAWIAPVLLVCAAVLVPWTAILFLTLPRHYGASHWQLAWAGFDVGLGIALANTAIAALHRPPRGEIAAAVTGTLLICDAWFDVLTSHGSADVAEAVGEAALIELPLAALCFWIVRSARRSYPSVIPTKGWSVYGAKRTQPLASGGKCGGLEKGSNKPKPLPRVATRRRGDRMVRRGSTVRVRQRASR
jgi:hypothetical protein